jgi:glutathione S-transferase
MALTFYYGSGSPFAWKVWLALEHKKLPYELRRLRFDTGELKTPEFLAINPRAQVPALVDGDLSLFESGAIVEYLEDAYPEQPLLPKDARGRAVARRIVLETDAYFFPAVLRLMRQTLFRRDGKGDPEEIAAAKREIAAELDRLEGYLTGEHFAGPLTLADFAVYPTVRVLGRIAGKFPDHDMTARFGPRLSAWKQRIDALPYVEKTTPPHWKDG